MSASKRMDRQIAQMRHRERMDEIVPITCSNCGQSITGRYEWAHRWFRLHAKRHHPEIRFAKKPKRLWGNVNGKTIEDAIAGAREQGAHAWSSDPREDAA